MVWPDLHQETQVRGGANLLIEKGVRSYCELPLTTAQKRFGALGLGSSRPNAYGEEDVQLLKRVAELVALALENAMAQAAFLDEKERLQMLLEVSTTLMSNLDVQQLFPEISGLIRRVIGQDFANVSLYEEASRCMRVYALDSPFVDELIGPETVVPITESASGPAFLQGEARVCGKFPGRDANTGDGNSIVLLASPDYSKRQAGNPEPGQCGQPCICSPRCQPLEASGGSARYRPG
jgi:formate hydrogenlyase transcriptional activator